jgi:hypothetical protein
MYHQKLSLEELENMIPFERDIYIMLLNDELRKEKEAYEKAQKVK